MNIVHIVPSAFNYFDDIRTLVFSIVDELDGVEGFNQDIFTLEYGSPSKHHQRELGHITHGRSYQGARSIDMLIARLDTYDIVHLHTPFLGAAKKLLAARNKQKPFVLSYYRDVELVDLLSYFIRWYNRVYLPQLAAVSSVVTSCAPSLFLRLQRVIEKKQITYIDLLSTKKPLTNPLRPVQLLSETPFFAEQFSTLYHSLT